MVYGDGLENRCLRKGTVGSNPTPSAILLGVQDLAITYIVFTYSPVKNFRINAIGEHFTF